ncbi:hypothetical protein AQUCO_00500185v1 [Aquilegia coerulea]|uniref:EF-hand domain-containing protein n=1 Tax=Aquilegia coerulea TaxID=218851 RepID=A0A2G5EQQ3_AQUCA|nr:hypothetical protein AQUCO_00500185v1 [Aquilegia coerulea]
MQKQVRRLHQTDPLFVPGTKTVKPQFIIALKRIFTLSDSDKDGVLNDAELIKFQLKCFNHHLSTFQVTKIKNYIQSKLSEGVNHDGCITLSGFFLLHAQHILKGHYNTIWMVLRGFGYSDDIVLRTNNEVTVSIEETSDYELLKLFAYTLKAMRYPPAPVYDHEAQTLKPLCVRALKRIFLLCDHDKDGALSDTEMKDVLEKFHDASLQTSEIARFKMLLQQKMPEGVNDRGITLAGFIYMYELNLREGDFQFTWMLLRKFGYGDDIKLKDGFIKVSFNRAPDQTVELTNEAIEFLKRIFSSFDLDADGILQPAELEDLFSTAPENPWDKPPYKDAAEITALEGRRQVDRKKQQSERNVFQCFVFGPRKAGKSALLNSFLGRQFTESYASTVNDRFAANVVAHPDGTTKTLILREIPEDKIPALLSCKESLAACDVAIFVHDSSDEQLWNKAQELLLDVASHGDSSHGFEVPCLSVASKADVSGMHIEKPILISTKLGDLHNIFHCIVNAAEHPHLNIPEIEVERTSTPFYNWFVSSTLVSLLVGGTVSLVVAYVKRKSVST